MAIINVFTDGASRGNPGKAGAGIVIYEGRNILDQFSKYLGTKTNNQAEYEAMILALEYLIDKKIPKANLFADSEFLVKQMTGKYKVKSEKIIPLYEKAQKLLEKVEIKFSWVRREDNALADELANEGIDSANKSKSKPPIKKESQSANANRNLLVDKAFFGQINCLKIQMSKDYEIYFHLGLFNKKTNEWYWEKVKMNEVELGEIINLLKHEEGKCSFFHSFEDKKTQIWCKKSKTSFSIKIKEISKNLSIGEFEVLRIILEEAIKLKNFN